MQRAKVCFMGTNICEDETKARKELSVTIAYVRRSVSALVAGRILENASTMKETESRQSCLRASLTVDVERRKGVASFDGVDSDVAGVLDFLRPICRATFFVAGEIADKKPGIVQAISDEGHEVACHGLHHERFDTLSAEEQLRRVRLATTCLESACGRRPSGFRAPEHRANTATMLVLEQLNYMYDSSVLPGTPFLRPEPQKKWRFIFAPCEPYHPSRTDLTRRGDCRVIELPCSTFILPFVSKLSMRSTWISDLLATILAMRARSRDAPIVYYLHSYDKLLSEGSVDWLGRVVQTLQRLGADFVTMNQLASMYGERKLLPTYGGS